MVIRKAGVAIGLGAMLVASVPAGAEDRRERHERWEDRHRGDRDGDRRGRHQRGEEISDTGAAVVAGALIIGGLAALFASKKKPPVALEPEPVAFGADADPERVISACVSAAEAEGRRTSAIAQVGQVRAVAPAAAGFAIDGDLLLRTSWREPGGRHAFRCAADAQAVRSVTIDGVRMLPAVAAN